MACSTDVNGPDSLTSTDRVPVSPATISSGSELDNAKIVPATAISAYSSAYTRRRPSWSARRARTIEARAEPASSDANTSPTWGEVRPPCASETPRITLPKP